MSSWRGWRAVDDNLVHVKQRGLVIPNQLSRAISCRAITVSDLPAITDLLLEGFSSRSRIYWETGLRHLAGYAPPEGKPRFGYMLEAEGIPVGVILLIFSNVLGLETPAIRCNVSSWYVRPEFSAYAPLLSLRATKNDAMNYIDVWPATNTLGIIEAQGFSKAGSGYFVGVPTSGRERSDVTILSRRAQWERSKFISPDEMRLLADHERFGCICFWCETKTTGRPFVFRKRWFKIGLSCAMLIYSRSLEDFELYAGRWAFSTRRWLPVMLVGSDRAVRGMLGRSFPEKLPLYYKGVHRARGSDLSYTDAAIFGI